MLQDVDLAFVVDVSYADTISVLLAVAVRTAIHANALVTTLYDQICDALLTYDGITRH